MILTGKAKEDFENWVEKETGHLLDEVKNDFTLHVNALIIEWFDSVGIYINISYELFSYKWKILGDMSYYDLKKHPTRQEATKRAIINANEIYNSSKN